MSDGNQPADGDGVANWFEQLQAEMAAEKWEARITRSGRWSWHVRYHRGLTALLYSDIVTGSKERAVRVAERKIAKLNRQDERCADETVIR